ncbi:TonB-dependent receptor [Spirosoma montaniterrae]|uniref:TonB-dependent receptor n=1 Tax=Spirosoma montaniterrae TaxID=1178516 RepID=A0A1P9WWT7_9BACT|nr:TonB-dependent receptor [Spirosoma montaniterrae]AQG79813.1 TonB-dependent receptor [Spirosoma montaniterrae]
MRQFTGTILFILFSLPALAQTGQISGTTTPFANVSLLKTRLGVQSDASGTFSLSAVPAGNYRLKISAVGFADATQPVTVRAGETTSVAIKLTHSAAYLEEVVVTASRKPENVKEVPSAMTIVGQRQIQEQAAMNPDITNILQYTVPGLAFTTGRTSNTGQTLRGRQVLVMIDGIPQSTPLRNGGRDLRIIDPSAIERIEVIKGATSIYGNGADGGIINYITKKASVDQPFTAQTWAGLSGQIGNADQTMGYRFSQQFTGRTNKIDYVLNGTFERTGLQRDATGVPISPFYNTGQMNSYNVLAKVGYTLTDRQRIEGMYNYYSSRSDLQFVEQLGVYGKTPTIGVPASGEQPGTPQGTPYNHNATLRYSYDRLLGGTSLEVVGYMQRFRTVYGYDAQFFENGGQSNVVSNKKGVRLNLNTPFALGKSLAGEWVYGVDLLNDQTAQKLQDGRFWTPDMNMTNLAPFAQLKLDFFQNLTLKAGARYENIGVVVSDFTTLKTYNATTKKYDGGIAVQGGTLTYQALVGNVGLRYSGSAAFQPFVSFSQAFSINELGRILRTSQRSIVSQLETRPIIVNNYEAGVSGQVGRFVHYDFALYESRSELGASYRTLPSGVFEIVRAPERVWGYEAALDLTPVRFLAVGGSYTYLEGKSDNNNNGDYETYLGGDRISAPKTTVYVRVQPNNRLSLNVNALRAGNRSRFSPAANGTYAYAQGPVMAYTLLNFSGSYQLTRKAGISLGVENLLNTDYYPAISQWAARAADYIKGPGRRAMLTLNYRW